MAKRETPTNTNDWNKSRPANFLDAQGWPEGTLRETTFTRKPETPLQALMEALPWEEPETSVEELQPLREIVAQAVDRLPARLKYVLECIHMERLSYQQLADRMAISKTHAFRLTREAETILKATLSANQLIREKLNLETKHKTWWEAAASHLSTLNPVGNNSTDAEICEAIASLLPEMRDAFERDNGEYLEVVDLIGGMAAEWLNNHGKWSASDIADILESKQQDYGHGNISAFGQLGIAVRLSDKVERMKNLESKQGKARNESFADTMLDIVGYCVIAFMLDDGTFYMEVGK
jgi:hypothetical protein